MLRLLFHDFFLAVFLRRDVFHYLVVFVVLVVFDVLLWLCCWLAILAHSIGVFLFSGSRRVTIDFLRRFYVVIVGCRRFILILVSCQCLLCLFEEVLLGELFCVRPRLR